MLPPELDAGLRAGVPYFGGKSRAAGMIWQRIGDVVNYVETHAGSLAVLLARPETHTPRVETANDLDGLVVNWWRAVAADPVGVAEGNQGSGEGRENSRRERIWFSPACLRPGRDVGQLNLGPF